MDHQEKRRHARIETKNLITQVQMDEDGRCIGQGIGRTLDVSQSGLKLETPYPVEGHRVSLVTVDLDDRLIEIAAKPLYCRQVEKDKYHTGLQFIGTEAKVKEFATQMVRLYQHRKHATLVNIAA